MAQDLVCPSCGSWQLRHYKSGWERRPIDVWRLRNGELRYKVGRADFLENDLEEFIECLGCGHTVKTIDDLADASG